MGTQSATTSLATASGSTRRKGVSSGGFTIIEAAMATVIIGVGVVAMVEAQQAFLISNVWSSHSATGAYLANEIREMTRTLPRHDPVTSLYIIPGEGADPDQLFGWGRETGEVTVDDFDDLDDFNGILFSDVGTTDPSDGDLPGPINSFGEVIMEIAADGSIVMTPGGDEEAPPTQVPMIGWSQQVFAEKVNPFNTAEVIAPGAANVTTAIDDFPVRMTVIVNYQGPWATAPEEVTRLVWIVPR